MPGRKKAADLERWLVALSGGSAVFIRSYFVYLCNDCEEMLTLMRLLRMQRKCGVNENKIQK